MTFEEFIAAGPAKRNSWIRFPGLSVYVRKPTGFSHNAGIELASMEADEPGNGALTLFLNKYESAHTFYIENILNDRLVGFLQRRGYRIVGGGNDLDICMIEAGCWHIKDVKTQ